MSPRAQLREAASEWDCGACDAPVTYGDLCVNDRGPANAPHRAYGPLCLRCGLEYLPPCQDGYAFVPAYVAAQVRP